MLRPLHVEQDAVSLHALDDTSFADAADYHRQSLEAFREEHLGAHDLDPQLSRVAERNGEIVGFLLARRRTTPPVGFVDILAVDPDHQRSGIGTALLTEAFRMFRAAGLEEAQLGVASTNPRALRAYEKLGMTRRFRYDTYEKPIVARRISRDATSLSSRRSTQRSGDDSSWARATIAANHSGYTINKNPGI